MFHFTRRRAASADCRTIPNAKLLLVKLSPSQPAELSHQPICRPFTAPKQWNLLFPARFGYSFFLNRRYLAGLQTDVHPVFAFQRRSGFLTSSPLACHCDPRHRLVRRRTISALITYHKLRVFRTVIEYGILVAADRRWPSSQTRRDGTGSLLRHRQHYCNVSSSLVLLVPPHTAHARKLTAHHLRPALDRARHTPSEPIVTLSTASSPSLTLNTQITGRYGSSAPKGRDIPTRPSMAAYGTTPGLITTHRLSGWYR